jgi:hypothetical protein
MSEWKKLDLYEMVKPNNKIGLFLTYLYNLNLAIFQPIYTPK